MKFCLKKLLFFIISFLLLFQTPSVAYAQSENKFEISSNSTYTINNEGIATVIQKIKIKNKTDYSYSPSYTTGLGFENIQNLKAFDSTGELAFDIDKKENLTIATIHFNRRVVGTDKENEFNISYSTKNVARKQGLIWEVYIPGLSNTSIFSDYTVEIKVPQLFGKLALTKPFKEFSEYSNSYTFSKNEIGENGIMLVFGEYQLYKMHLTYHLQNPNLFPIENEIALPPTTNYQDVLISSITPKPSRVYEDSDGNWLALYSLKPQQKLTILVDAFAKIYHKPQKVHISSAQKSEYSKALAFWEANNSEIKSESSKFTDEKSIYDFVVKSLSYNYNKSSDSNTRLGGKEALKNTKNAVCLEFTDLFVTLARAKGIPSRSVEGYAYTEDARLRPRSLVKDILHAWPEFYDEDKQTWVMIDPTWGNTTDGVDYFYSLDFDHIAFVIKGMDSTYPIPAGGYKEDRNAKDIQISFAKESDFLTRSEYAIESKFANQMISGFAVKGEVVIKNLGNIPLTHQKLTVSSEHTSERVEFEVDSIPPLGSKSYFVEFPRTPFLTNRELTLTMLFGERLAKTKVYVSIVPADMLVYVLGGVVCAGILTFIILTIKTRRVFVQRSRK